MRKKIVTGNWKMNTDLSQAVELIEQIVSKSTNSSAQIIICPPYPFLDKAVNTCKNSTIKVGAQNCSQNNNGAFTGEVSVEMLKSLNVEYIIVGHSERRSYFNEDNKQIAAKVEKCLENGITPIFCCGEQLSDRNTNNHFDVIKKQTEESLFQLSESDFSKIVIAYEPVWAIGTGNTATPQQAQEMHHYIRELIAKKYGKKSADSTPILYGGSCNAKNAKELFALSDVDGGLSGGASLKAEEFITISNSF